MKGPTIWLGGKVTIRSFSFTLAFVFVFWSGLLSVANAQADASDRLEAFGLRFGDSYTTASAKGLQAEFQGKDGSLTNYKSIKLPKQPSTTDMVGLTFDQKHGLQRITWLSKNVTDDPFGSKGKEQFSELKAVLEKKYGSPDSRGTLEAVGISLYKDADEFYECLDYSGCGMWTAFWTGSYGAVALSIATSGDRGVGWLQVVYEGPAWEDLIDARNARTDQLDADAF